MPKKLYLIHSKYTICQFFPSHGKKKKRVCLRCTEDWESRLTAVNSMTVPAVVFHCIIPVPVASQRNWVLLYCPVPVSCSEG